MGPCRVFICLYLVAFFFFKNRATAVSSCANENEPIKGKINNIGHSSANDLDSYCFVQPIS